MLKAGDCFAESTLRYRRARNDIKRSYSVSRLASFQTMPVVTSARCESDRSPPPELGYGPATPLVIFDLDVVLPGTEGHFGLVVARRVVVPLVNDQLPVHPRPHPVVGQSVETIGASLKVRFPVQRTEN